jgi:hypothetical protein
VTTPENLAANLIAKNVNHSSKKRTNIVAKFSSYCSKTTSRPVAEPAIWQAMAFATPKLLYFA